jgi:hypothetical protein
MANIAKAQRLPEPRGVLYWMVRAVICLLVAPLFGVMVGIIGGVAGLFLGEIAAILVLIVFMADIFIRLIRGRRFPATYQPEPAGIWDRHIDG